MKKLTTMIPSDVVVGQYLQIAVLAIAAAIAFVYACGYTVGVIVHKLNDQLTAFHQLPNAERVQIAKQTLITYINNALQS